MIAELWEQLGTYLRSGGFVMPPLVLGAAAMWYALGRRLLTLRRGNTRSVRILVQRYREGYARPPTGIVDTAVVRGLALARLYRGPELRRALDEEMGAVQAEMARFGALVTAIVACAPLLGLLGTVAGMIETFDSLADMALYSRSGGVAGGIATALVSTQTGLVTAVPGLLVGRLLKQRERRLALELTMLKDILVADSREAPHADAA